jgi:hypothetical protein
MLPDKGRNFHDEYRERLSFQRPKFPKFDYTNMASVRVSRAKHHLFS